MSFECAFQIIRNFLKRGHDLSTVYVDTVGSPEKYTDLLKKEFSHYPKIEFVVRKKADSLFKVVSAASIVAKVTRD